MNKLSFALVVHNHQPVGNADPIVESVYKRSYLPFLKVLAAHPEIKLNLHYTGFLLEWIERNHPEFIKLLKEIVNRGQVEMIGGAYYEPIVSVIPDTDASGQIKMLSEKVENLFGQRPRGFWTAERAWEPQLPEILRGSGAEFTFLDDEIFHLSGVDASRCFACYSVESRGSFVTVFPMPKNLRYLVPFKPVPRTISLLKKVRSEGADIAVFADDGEKFGAWPSTYELVYERGWLDDFFKALEKNKESISTLKISDYVDQHPPKERIYLPSASYPEMMDWAIPYSGKSYAEKPRGFWRLFFAKYPESASLYSKMLETSKLVKSLGSENHEALKELWKGECNDAYWHGVFGGLYAPILRKNTYSHLIRAHVLSERLARSKAGVRRNNWISIQVNKQERNIVVETQKLGVMLSLFSGSIAELDFKPMFVNVLDTLGRRPEQYHRIVRAAALKRSRPKRARMIHETPPLKERGLEKLLSYDRYPKFAFTDFLVRPDATRDSFQTQDYHELAWFASEAYDFKISETSGSALIKFSKTLNEVDDSNLSVELEKEYEILANATNIFVKYRIGLKQSSGSLRAKFVPEVNLGCLSDSVFAREHKKTALLQPSSQIKYPEAGVVVKFSSKASKNWMIPIRTVSLSETGLEGNLQGVSILPFHDIELTSGEPFEATLGLDLKSI